MKINGKEWTENVHYNAMMIRMEEARRKRLEERVYAVCKKLCKIAGLCLCALQIGIALACGSMIWYFIYLLATARSMR